MKIQTSGVVISMSSASKSAGTPKLAAVSKARRIRVGDGANPTKLVVLQHLSCFQRIKVDGLRVVVMNNRTESWTGSGEWQELEQEEPGRHKVSGLQDACTCGYTTKYRYDTEQMVRMVQMVQMVHIVQMGQMVQTKTVSPGLVEVSHVYAMVTRRHFLRPRQ